MLAETEAHCGGHGKDGEGRSIDVMEARRADSWQEVGYINATYWFRYVGKVVGGSRCATLKSA